MNRSSSVFECGSCSFSTTVASVLTSAKVLIRGTAVSMWSNKLWNTECSAIRISVIFMMHQRHPAINPLPPSSPVVSCLSFSHKRGPWVLTRVLFHPRAGADGVAVAENIVHAPDDRPELVIAQARHRERRPFARIWPVPVVRRNHVRRVRRILEQVVLLVRRAGFNGRHLRMDGNHRITKPVEFRLRFALGRLNHERVGPRPRQRWGMKAVTHQPLDPVLGSDLL